MGMPYGYNNSPYGMGQNSYAGQNPYAGYNTAPQQAPQASLSPEQIQQLNMQNQYLAQQNAQELGNNITNAAIIGGGIGAAGAGIETFGGEEGNLKQQYTYKQGGKEYGVTLKDKVSNPIAKRLGVKSENEGRAVKHLRDRHSSYEFSNYYQGDVNTPMTVKHTIQDGSSLKPVELLYRRNDKGVLELVDIKTPTGKKINPKLLRLDMDLLQDLKDRRDAAKKGWKKLGFSPEVRDLEQRIKVQERAVKEAKKAVAMLGNNADEVERLAKNGLKEGVDLPNLGKVVQEARIDKALDWSSMLKNVAKGGGIALLGTAVGAGLLTLLMQRRPAYAQQSSPTPPQGFRPY